MTMVFRIIYFFVFLISITFFPFWLSVILAVFGVIYFSVFWEMIPLLVLSELLFGTHKNTHSFAIFISFFVALIVLILAEILKKKLKFYPKALIK